jgi:L-aspartate oxidase
VLILTKGKATDCCTALAQGGIASALGATDNPLLHYQDTLDAGAGLCDSRAVNVLVNEGPLRVRELVEWGVQFNRISSGEFDLGREAAHSQNRILHSDDSTGDAVHRVLLKRVQSIKNITLQEDTKITQLLSDAEYCFGASDDHEKKYFAQATVLATGGAGQLYQNTTNPTSIHGDGMMLAYEAGAELIDLEFVQFHPTGFLLSFPDTPLFLISEAVRGEGAVLRNVYRQRFVDELAPRDVVTRAIFEEMQKTKSSHVLLDMSSIKENIRQRFPSIYRMCQEFHVDITKDVVPVAPVAHYMMGGVKTDLNGATAVGNLYAIGEVACTGVDGANRLASNSLLAGLVFGTRAVEHILKSTASRAPVFKQKNFSSPSFSSPSILFEIKEILWNHVGICRSQSSLTTAITLLNELPEHLSEVALSRLLAESARQREESRGAHFREDYPRLSEKPYRIFWQKQACQSQRVVL